MSALLCAIGKKEQSAALIAKRLAGQIDLEAINEPSNELLRIKGSQGLSTHFASCCYPVPDEAIEAYLDAKQGLVVHRDSCAVLHDSVPSSDIMEVVWAEQDDQEYLIAIKTLAHNVVGVLRQITSTLAQQNVNIEDIHTSGDMYLKETKLVLWVKNITQAQAAIRQLEHIQDIIKVERIT